MKHVPNHKPDDIGIPWNPHMLNTFNPSGSRSKIRIDPPRCTCRNCCGKCRGTIAKHCQPCLPHAECGRKRLRSHDFGSSFTAKPEKRKKQPVLPRTAQESLFSSPKRNTSRRNMFFNFPKTPSVPRSPKGDTPIKTFTPTKGNSSRGVATCAVTLPLLS